MRPAPVLSVVQAPTLIDLPPINPALLERPDYDIRKLDQTDEATAADSLKGQAIDALAAVADLRRRFDELSWAIKYRQAAEAALRESVGRVQEQLQDAIETAAQGEPP